MSTPKLLVAALCSLATLGAATAPAGATAAAQDGAIVYHGGPCSFRLGGFPLVVATNVHSVITPSGNASLTCQGELPPGTAPETAVTIDLDGRCRIGTPNGIVVATRGSVTYTPSGHANLSCHYKP
jgi:hypothetical protein